MPNVAVYEIFCVIFFPFHLCSLFYHLSLRRPSLSHSSEVESASLSRCSGLLPKFAISAEVEEVDGSLAVVDSSKVAFTIGETPQNEPEATTPCSTMSGSTLSGTMDTCQSSFWCHMVLESNWGFWRRQNEWYCEPKFHRISPNLKQNTSIALWLDRQTCQPHFGGSEMLLPSARHSNEIASIKIQIYEWVSCENVSNIQ